MALLQVGPIRLATTNSLGVKTATLILPPPSRDGLDLSWEDDATTVSLATGGRRTRRIGFLPVLKVTWKVYDEPKTPGITEGLTPSLEQLLTLLSAGSRGLRISPGLTAGGFAVDQVKVEGVGKLAGFYTGVSATFYGRDALATMTLETF
jgi:hypothetical protein